MSNYIIAGEAGNPDLSDCEFLGKKLEASTPNTNVHIIAKHSTEWDEFLKRLCSSYGFKEASNPIVFTVDGKLIGDKQSFREHVLSTYSVRGELDKNMRALISEFDKTSLENSRQKAADGPSVKDQVKERLNEIVSNGNMRILDGFFETNYDRGFQFWQKQSNMLSPFTYDDFDQYGESLEFIDVPELMTEKHETEIFSPKESKITEEAPVEQEEGKVDDDKGSESPVPEKEKSPSGIESPLATNSDEGNLGLLGYEVTDKNIKNFIEYFSNETADESILYEISEVMTPTCIKTITIYEDNIVRDLPKDYLLALSPFPLVPCEMIVFSGRMVEGGWLLRDFSMMQNWLKLVNIPPQRPVYRDGDIIDQVIPREPVYIKDMNSNCMSQRGFTCRTIDLNLTCTRDPYLKLNSINVYLRHILTECDWEIWHKVLKDLGALGYYQFLPYGEQK